MDCPLLFEMFKKHQKLPEVIYIECKTKFVYFQRPNPYPLNGTQYQTMFAGTKIFNKSRNSEHKEIHFQEEPSHSWSQSKRNYTTHPSFSFTSL